MKSETSRGFRIPKVNAACGGLAGYVFGNRAKKSLFGLGTAAGNGRDGQIRTADLSLRRRPLYPSELRPRTDVPIVPFQTLRSNILAIMHAGELNPAGRIIGIVDRYRQVGATGSYAENTSACSL